MDARASAARLRQQVWDRPGSRPASEGSATHTLWRRFRRGYRWPGGRSGGCDGSLSARCIRKRRMNSSVASVMSFQARMGRAKLLGAVLLAAIALRRGRRAWGPHIRLLAPLAFLSPRIIAAIMMARHPRISRSPVLPRPCPIPGLSKSRGLGSPRSSGDRSQRHQSGGNQRHHAREYT
jgi:hypothetical protein